MDTQNTFNVTIAVANLGTLGKVKVPAANKDEAIAKANAVVFHPRQYVEAYKVYEKQHVDQVTQFEEWIEYELGIQKERPVAPKSSKIPFEVAICIMIACGLNRKNK